MLILAVAIVIAKNVVRSVGLISSNSKCDSNVALFKTHKCIKGAQLGIVARHSLGEFCRFRADGRAPFDPVFLERPVPPPHLLPALKTADLHVRRGEPTARRLDGFFLVAS